MLPFLQLDKAFCRASCPARRQLGPTSCASGTAAPFAGTAGAGKRCRDPPRCLSVAAGARRSARPAGEEHPLPLE